MPRTIALPRVVPRANPFSMLFPGTSTNRVDFGSATNARSQTFTMTAWIRSQGTGSRTIIGDSTTGGIQVRLTSSNQLNLVKQNSVNMATSTGVVQPGMHQHIAVTYNSPNIAFYINGQPAGTASNAQTFTFGNLQVGNRGSTEQFAGSINQVKQFNQALTAEQVLDIYQNGYTPGVSPTLNADFSEGSGSTTTESANGYVGTINVATWSTDVPFTTRQLTTRRRNTVGGSLIPNFDLFYVPGSNTPQTTAGFYDGTAGGAGTTPNQYSWYYNPVAGGTSMVMDTSNPWLGIMPWIKLSTTNTSGRVRANSVQGNGVGGITPLASNRFLAQPIPPNTSVTASMLAKTNNVALNGAFGELAEMTASGSVNVIGSTNKLTGTNDITVLSVTATTSSTARFIILTLQNSVAGNVSDAWFTNMVVTPTSNTSRGIAL